MYVSVSQHPLGHLLSQTSKRNSLLKKRVLAGLPRLAFKNGCQHVHNCAVVDRLRDRESGAQVTLGREVLLNMSRQKTTFVRRPTTAAFGIRALPPTSM